MTNRVAVRAYLNQQKGFLPEHMQGIMTCFTLNLIKLIEIQQCVDADVILQACFLPSETREFQNLRSAFIDYPELSANLRDVMGPVYKIQGLLFGTSKLYEKEFSQLSPEQVDQSKKLVSSWAQGVLAAWKKDKALGNSQGPKKTSRVVWADNPLLRGGPKPLTVEYFIYPETGKVQQKNGD